MTNFADFGLSETILSALNDLKFEKATPIQEKAIPFALMGHDIIGSAQTGTGKTGAFAIPISEKMSASETDGVLVLAPTRELATQVMAQFKLILKNNKQIKDALLIGGDSLGKQFDQLRRKPRLIVGTPGRVNDHLNRGTLSLKNTRYLVLDETDRMLDMGFGIQLETIIEKISADRQTMMFSATLPKKIEQLAKQYMQPNAERVSCGNSSEASQNIQQDILMTSENDKYKNLVEELNKREGSIIVFTNTKRSADQISARLNDDGHSCDAIHGDLRQSRRERVLTAFRKNKYRILVATDVAARGLDVPSVMHVINLHLPHSGSPEDYVHRIGRTARAGAKGFAISFITPADRRKWREINRMMDPSYKEDERFLGMSDVDSDKRRSRGRTRPGGGGGDRNYGRTSKPFGDRPRSGGDFRDRKPRAGGDFGDKPRFNDRPKRAEGEFGDKPRFNDRPRRAEGEFGDKPRFNDRPRRAEGEFGDRPRFNDRPRSGGDFGDKPRFNDRPRRTEGEFGDRPKRTEGGFGDRPKFNDRPRSGGDFGDRPKFNDRPRGDRPAGRFGDKPKFGDRPRSGGDFGDRPRGDRPAGRFGDKPKFGGDRPRSSERSGGSFGGDKPRFNDRPRSSERSSEGTRTERPAGSFGDRPRFGGKPKAEGEKSENRFSNRARDGKPTRTFNNG